MVRWGGGQNGGGGGRVVQEGSRAPEKVAPAEGFLLRDVFFDALGGW